jgi:hypothetical protein
MPNSSVHIASRSGEGWSPEREFAEEFGATGERIGMPRMVARLLGWMLICDPPRQSTTDLARALGVSRASISIATRLLEASHLIKRAAQPGVRGHAFELDSAFFTGQLDAASPFGTLRRLMERGIEIAGGDADPRATRLREARDFYAFVEHAIPEAIARYRDERGLRKETEHR